jgi:hypothetical protein
MATKAPSGREKAARRPMHPRAKQQRLEMLAGILGFFTVVFFLDTLYMEVTGGDALGPALILLLLAVGLGVVLQKRWQVFSRR